MTGSECFSSGGGSRGAAASTAQDCPLLVVPSHCRSRSSPQTTSGLRPCSPRPTRCMQAGHCTMPACRCLSWATSLSQRGSAPSQLATSVGRTKRLSCKRATAALPGSHGSRPLPQAPERSRSGLGTCHDLRSSGRSKDGTYFMRSTYRRAAAARGRVPGGPGAHDGWHQLRLPARQHARRRDRRRAHVHAVRGRHRLHRCGRLVRALPGGSFLG